MFKLAMFLRQNYWRQWCSTVTIALALATLGSVIQIGLGYWPRTVVGRCHWRFCEQTSSMYTSLWAIFNIWIIINTTTISMAFTLAKFLQKKSWIQNKNSAHPTCLGHLGWCVRNRIISVCVMSPKVVKTSRGGPILLPLTFLLTNFPNVNQS